MQAFFHRHLVLVAFSGILVFIAVAAVNNKRRLGFVIDASTHTAFEESRQAAVAGMPGEYAGKLDQAIYTLDYADVIDAKTTPSYDGVNVHKIISMAEEARKNHGHRPRFAQAELLNPHRYNFEMEDGPRQVARIYRRSILPHRSDKEFSQLPPALQSIGYVLRLMGDVDNGGLRFFFASREGKHAVQILRALQDIKAEQAHTILKTACQLFGEEGPDENLEKRQEQLEQFEEGEKSQQLTQLSAQLYDERDDIYKNLLKTYLAYEADKDAAKSE